MKCGALKVGLIATIVVVLFSALAYSQPLNGRSEVELSFGYMNKGAFLDESYAGGTVDREGMNDMYAKLGFNHWLSDDLAFSIMLSALASDSYDRKDVYLYDREEIGVVTIFSGIRYYLPSSMGFYSWRPYLSLMAGPVIGSKIKDYVGDEVIKENRSQAALGGYIGAGIDFQVSHRIMLGINGGYTAMTDFDEAIGGKDNFSGPEFGVSAGFLFGHGK